MKKLLPLAIILGSFIPQNANALETDQYMTWNLELKDSSQAFNNYFNEELIPNYLDVVNSKRTITESKEELIEGLYKYAFHGLFSSRIRKFLGSSEEIDRFPDKSVSYRKYKKSSIYKSDAPFPWFFLPMSRTINIDGNYLGVDKIGHFFGFGRRYFNNCVRYLQL